MMSHQLSSGKSANNYRTEGDVVYGVYQGCGFAVSEEDGGKLFIFMLSAADNAAFDDFENALASTGGQLAEGQVGDVENYLAVFFDESRGNIANATLDQILSFTASQARNCGFRVPNVCVQCGAKATKRSFLNNMVQPLCADCSAQNKQSRHAAAAVPPVAPFATAPAPIASQDDNYARQYAPLVPDSSKYDDSYDEYAGMQSRHGGNGRYADPYGGTFNDGYDDGNNPPVTFDDTGDDYRDIMGNGDDSDDDASDLGGSVGMGLLGAVLGACIGVIPYILIALILDFHMAALCFPAGMLAVLFYTFLHGLRGKGTGMGVSIGVSIVISFATMFLSMIFSYVNDTRTFSQALSYVFSEQLTFFLINSVFSILGSIFGAFFMINKMDDYCRD